MSLQPTRPTAARVIFVRTTGDPFSRLFFVFILHLYPWRPKQSIVHINLNHFHQPEWVLKPNHGAFPTLKQIILVPKHKQTKSTAQKRKIQPKWTWSSNIRKCSAWMWLTQLTFILATVLYVSPSVIIITDIQWNKQEQITLYILCIFISSRPKEMFSPCHLQTTESQTKKSSQQVFHFSVFEQIPWHRHHINTMIFLISNHQ